MSEKVHSHVSKESFQTYVQPKLYRLELIEEQQNSLQTHICVWSVGCPNHWKRHGNSCYLFIQDVPEDFIEAGLETFRCLEGYWIGLSDIVFEGDWVWTSSQASPSYTDWSPTSPDNYQNHQDCAMFWYALLLTMEL
uniref:Uncharacterized protein n=1 Tax=Magallana gigas TaxID=29159 RepID=K1PKD9_MAGGI